jgi:spermidine/putrescine transport system ATP-binding protein
LASTGQTVPDTSAPAEPVPENAEHFSEVDVRLDGVTKRFDDVVAVDDVSLEIERGSFFALLGPSGCGKTTTLRMIGGFEEPTGGTIYLGERDVTNLPSYKRDVNTVFQSYALFPHLSIFENVAFGLRRRGIRGNDLKQQVGESLELVALGGLERRKPRQLSGGQQQRVALARALVNRPRVLLLDEPLGALDLKLRKQMQLELKGIQHEVGVTFIHVTHDQEEAMTMADRIAVMNEGHVEQLGTPSELYERPRTAFVAGFLGVSNLLFGRAAGKGVVQLEDGSEIRVDVRALNGHAGRLAVGIRPEKLRLGGEEANTLDGVIAERSYIGVSTQYIVETPSGAITVYVQNAEPGTAGATEGDRVTLSWNPEATFVVDAPQEDNP